MTVLTADDHVVVVGAGLAGFRFVEALRREGYAGRLTLIGAEHHPPYDRPPLSKQVLAGAWEPERVLLSDLDRLAALDVDVRLGVPATALDAHTGDVTLADGSEIQGSFVVLSCGVRARRLSLTATNDVHVVRTLDDVAGLRDVLATATSDPVVVIGGGFIGAESATAARNRGHDVIVLESLVRPLRGVLGDTVAQWLEPLAASFGVDLRCNQEIDDVVRDPDGLRVTFADGTSLRASVVLEGVGAVPNDEWLVGSGVTVDNGVVVNDRLHAAKRVAALGDIARFRWRHEPFDELIRIEHWQVANDHASYLARSLAGVIDEPLALLPYFWSDQYGKKIQVLGYPHRNDEVRLVAGDPADGKFLALYEREGCTVAMVALSMPRALMVSKDLIVAHRTVAESLALAPWSS